MTRTVGQKLSETFKQPVIVENRPGANSITGVSAVARADPDGYTFGTVIAAHAVNPSLNPTLPFDVTRDFTYISLMSIAPLMLVVRKSLPVSNVEQLISLAKVKPGTLNYGSSGIGAGAHLTMELLMKRTGVKMTHVTYKGGADALRDLVAEQLDLEFDVVGNLVGQVQAGTIKAIAVSSKKRMTALPTVPTMEEEGFPDFVSGTWAGIIAPTGVSHDIINRLSLEIDRIVKETSVSTLLESRGYEPAGGSAADFGRFFRVEVERWADVIKSSNIKIER